MHTPSEKFSAAESAEKWNAESRRRNAKSQAELTPEHFTDLVCYTLACAESQLQPEKFIAPDDAVPLIMSGEQDKSFVTVFMVNGWPLAVQSSDGEFTYVLSGIPLITPPELRLIVPEKNRLRYVPVLFLTPFGESMVMDWLRQHSDYSGGYWHYFVIPEGAEHKIANHACLRLKTTGYIAPDFNGSFHISIPGNYFDAELSADASGIVSTLMILNYLIWKAYEKGPAYAGTCQMLTSRQDALKDYVSLIKHPEAHLIFRAIN